MSAWPAPAALVQVLLAAALSGCVGTEGATPESLAPADGGPGRAGGTTLAWRNISVDVGWTSPGISGPYAGWDGPSCEPPPGLCEWVGHETIYLADDLVLDGTFLDTARIRPDLARTLYGTWVFTGTIVGCTGAGTATFPYTATADSTSPITPNTNGEVIHGHEYFTAPTDASGLVIGDAQLHAEFDTDPVDISVSNGRLTGYIVCQ